MNRDQIARLFTVTPGTVVRWARDGMPTARGGGNGVQAWYRPSACVTWRLAQLQGAAAASGGLNDRAERARKDKARADLDEYALKIKQGEYIPRAAFVLEARNAVEAMKARLLALGHQMVQRGLVTPTLEGAVTAIVTEALAELARIDELA